MTWDSTSVTRSADGVYRTTIPRALGDMHELEGADLRWLVHDYDPETDTETFKLEVQR